MIIEVKDNVIITEWWTSKEEEDGKKQITKETVYGKNKGRSNETTDNEQAILEYERKIRKKKEEGYVENRKDAILGEEIVVSAALSQAFAPCKPISKLKKDDDPYDGEWLAERKFDGSCILLHNTGTEKIGYTRRIKPITEILSVVKEIRNALEKLPGGFFPTKKADGGRVGFNVGGITDPAALAIYNSMNAYGFSDQEIADAITAQGYDAGTLGQTTTPDTPTAPTPGEGIIGIDLQQRDTGDGFNPFGPLQSTFSRDLTDVDMYKGVNVEGLTPFQQMQKFKTATQDNMFGLGRFFQPKIRGTLGNRLQRQFQTGQKLPSPLAKIAGAQSPFNIDSKNYNPDFVDQLNYLEGMDGLIGMSSVGLKYGPESVLAGKNVISGFGSNNYLTALNKFIRNTKNEERRKQGERERDAFLAAEKARKEAERQQALTIAQAAQRSRDRDRIDRAYREETGGQAGSYGTGQSGVQADGSYNDPFDPGGGE